MTHWGANYKRRKLQKSKTANYTSCINFINRLQKINIFLHPQQEINCEGLRLMLN